MTRQAWINATACFRAKPSSALRDETEFVITETNVLASQRGQPSEPSPAESTGSNTLVNCEPITTERLSNLVEQSEQKGKSDARAATGVVGT